MQLRVTIFREESLALERRPHDDRVELACVRLTRILADDLYDDGVARLFEIPVEGIGIADLERKARLEVGCIRLVPWIETAMAIVDAYRICASSPRIVGVAFGAEDYTNDMGIERTQSDAEILYPRSVIAVAARAARVLALDTPYFGFRDPDGLRRDAETARSLGFRGKFAIHPAQIEIINETFSPSPAEIEQARKVVSAMEEAKQRGRGSTSLDGQVIDVPVVRRAERLLEVAERMGGQQ